ncbi:GAF and ANTAR domain-containing protein [Actinopolymorpha singaporensis]|uniref:ANTAR domain-containing protein n=1 Tax=Actinopolymorpha singaporensis TaxID=117157 RepID=A0A1H1RXI5_9ACTN|nr:GAF and ANTAR domain-containing protein [Actinopolymorpha singaporensis]SDS40420.1 ANTAR domain-containing protein [Actinopolymorpha singaporensis]
MADDPLGDALASIVAEGGDGAPLRVCRAGVAALPIDGAAITMMTGLDRQEPICASDEVAGRIDELQFTLGEGPCMEAFASGHPVLIPDLQERVDRRWPVFSLHAQRTAARGLYVLPLQLGAIKVGVMDLYSLAPGELPLKALTNALRMADAAMWTLLDRREEYPEGLPAHEAEAMYGITDLPLHRAEIHQATGVILAQAGVSAAQALAMLRAYAFANERPIDEVARDVVARRLRFAGETP